jgi:hypothetical protein
MKEKEVIILIQGLKRKPDKNKLLNVLFGTPQNNNWMTNIQQQLKRKTKIKIINFNWDRKLTKISQATEKLEKIIEYYSSVTLFAKSAGVIIAKKIIRKHPSKIKKAILIAMSHRTSIPKNLNIVNLYSKKDILAKCSGGFIYPLSLRGARNIEIKKFQHEDFNLNTTVNIFGKKEKLFDVYSRLILSKV